jgi:hypothetical protein
MIQGRTPEKKEQLIKKVTEAIIEVLKIGSGLFSMKSQKKILGMAGSLFLKWTLEIRPGEWNIGMME